MKNGGVHFSLPEVSTSRESRPKLTYPQVVSVLPSIFCRGSKSTNFQKSSTWYKIWVLGGIILCTPFAMIWNPKFWGKSGKLPAAAPRCISEELLLSSSGQSGVNKSRWELLLQMHWSINYKMGDKYLFYFCFFFDGRLLRIGVFRKKKTNRQITRRRRFTKCVFDVASKKGHPNIYIYQVWMSVAVFA